MESSETWKTKALKSFVISKSGMQGGEAKRNLPWSILDDSHVNHFWSTSWSPIYACYMSFRSSGSQQSNASNGVQFGVEMKDLHPLESNHSKLKEEFCTALRNHPFAAKWFRNHFVQCCVSPLKFPVTMEAEYHKLKDHFAALRNQPFVVKWFRSPFYASTKSRRPRFHLQNAP